MKKSLSLLVISLLFAVSISAQGIAGKWKLSSLQNGKNNPVEIVAPVTLNFSGNNKIGGKGGCNSFGGSYTLGKSTKVSFSNIISTKMYCEGTSSLEDTFFQSLQNAKTAKIKSGKLYLENKEKDIILVFEKVK